MRWPAAFLILVAFSSTSFGASTSGIPRDLARERAQLISDLHYQLTFILVAHASTTTGHEDLTFQLKSAAPLLLDYREGTANNRVRF